MLKEQEYFDFVRRDASEDPRTSEASYFGIESEFHREYEQLIEGLAAKGQALAALKKKAQYGLSADEEKQMAALAADVDKGQTAFTDYLKRLASAFSQTDAEQIEELAEKNLATARALQGTLEELGPGVVLIHYVMSQDELHLILTTPGTQLVRRSLISEFALNQLINEYRSVLQNPRREPFTLGRTLYEHLISPLEADLKSAEAHTLLVYLDGALRYLPLAALYDGEHFLSERFAPVVFTAAAQDKLKDRPPVAARLTGLGLTQAHEDFAALPAVAMELEQIVRRDTGDADGVLPGEIYLDKAFTPRAMQQSLLRGYPLMHIASHFRFSAGGNENDSFLLLGDGTHLSLAELNSSLYEFKQLDLLTLSACETGLGVRANGEEVEGFGVLAQKKGAASVLATLWPVVDTSTGIFMQEFYRLLAEQPELNKAEALRRVQTMFIARNSRSAADKRYRHPFFWAPFILMGNWL
jgi:CHAT domain-containing protein